MNDPGLGVSMWALGRCVPVEEGAEVPCVAAVEPVGIRGSDAGVGEPGRAGCVKAQAEDRSEADPPSVVVFTAETVGVEESAVQVLLGRGNAVPCPRKSNQTFVNKKQFP
jgi:hypothetical protein